MGIETAKTGKLLYHLTKLKNLESIISNGLIPRKVLNDNTVSFGDVANPEIISKRSELGLDEYIPFHFHPYSAFDVAVKRSHADDEMIYICITRELARYNKFKVLPKHPLSLEECKVYDYDEGFSKIDWDTLMEVGRVDEEAKKIKMAECLSHLIIPVKFFQCIYVPSQEVKVKVEQIFEEQDVVIPPPYINVMPVWFQ